MPEDIYGDNYKFLKSSEWLTFEEIVRLAGIFVSLGVKKIRITGGEPLLRPGLHELIRMLSAIEGVEDLALTTNGLWLNEQALDLRKAGLKRLTVSLDSLNKEVFSMMSGRRGNVRRVLDGIRAAQEVGFSPIKINTVVQRGVNDHLLVDMIKHFKGPDYILRFIEFMDVGNRNQWDINKVVPAKEIVEVIEKNFSIEPIQANYSGEVAQRYRFKDEEGEFGLIASVTQPFCGSCSRLRLSTDGKIYTCLFAAKGADLRSLLRDGASDLELSNFVKTIWKFRNDQYSEQRVKIRKNSLVSDNKVEMFYIGG